VRKLEASARRFYIKISRRRPVPASDFGEALMQKHSPHPSPDPPPAHAPLWLAASGGQRRQRPVSDVVGDIHAPETPMEIEFFGLNEAEQRMALAAFPGGRRFVLARRA
jgi:hypothetical protein